MMRVLVTRERLVPTDDPARAGASGGISPQLTAFFTSATILASSVAVNSLRANATGHRAPSSRFAVSLKPKVAYLVLNFCPLWKKQTTLPSLAYAGMPYQVFGERAGALALMIAWSRLAMARSGSCIAAIFASTSPSPSALPFFPRGPRRASAFSSWARSFIAARSSSVNPLDTLTVVLLADCCVPFFAGFVSAIAKHLPAPNESQPLDLWCDRRTARRSSWMRIRLPAGSRTAQSRTPYGCSVDLGVAGLQPLEAAIEVLWWPGG